jgi:hypothetical protein
MKFFGWLFLLSLIATNTPSAFGGDEFYFALPGEWEERTPPYQGVVLSYVRRGSSAAVDLIVRPFSEDSQSAVDLTWESLFSPQFSDIQIENEGLVEVDGVWGKYCVYTIREGALKQALELDDPMKYLNYVFVRNRRLYSITFSDRETDFAANWILFRRAIQNLRFGSPGAGGRKGINL